MVLRSRVLLFAGVGLAFVFSTAVLGCSAGDPPDPEAASTVPATSVPPEDGGTELAEEDELELPDADDAVLDALEERFEHLGVKDIRGDATRFVTIRMEDESSIADAGPTCAAVRAAGFSDVRVDIDEVMSPCP